MNQQVYLIKLNKYNTFTMHEPTPTVRGLNQLQMRKKNTAIPTKDKLKFQNRNKDNENNSDKTY